MGKYNNIKSAIDKCSENIIFTSFDKIILKNNIIRKSNENIHKKIDKKHQMNQYMKNNMENPKKITSS